MTVTTPRGARPGLYGGHEPVEYRSEDGVAVWHGDCRDTTRRMPDNAVDAIVTDPPYEKGIAGQGWDRSGIAFDVDMWADAVRVVRPGGWIAAFGDSARVHRMTCAIEDAGAEIVRVLPWLHQAGKGSPHLLKAAHEPIVIARKPGASAVMGIDVCRVPREVGDRTNYGRGRDLEWKPGASGVVGKYAKNSAYQAHPDGRHPCDVVFAHAPILDEDGAPVDDACAGGCVPGCQVAALDVEGGWPTFRYEKTVRDRRERPFYVNADGVLVTHPTIKPLTLIAWLLRLLVPRGGTVLDLFAGSGTTVEAAVREGWCDVVAVERAAAYLRLIDIRIDRARHSIAAADAAATVPLW